jgi:ribonuclease J
LVEDKGTRIFLDFGMQMGKANQYFAEFVNPRICNGMGDLFEFGLLPKLEGLYRRDYAKHMEFGGNEDTAIHAVVLTHAHVDHAAYIHYLRPEIPIYCSEATKLIMQGFQDTGSAEEYIIFKENFKLNRKENGEVTRARASDNKLVRKINTFTELKKFSIDSIEVEPIYVDHSLPGVCGFIFHTSMGSIGYTADIRLHGRRESNTNDFIEKCGKSDLDITRDLDRLLSFYNASKESNRELVIDLKQAYILKLFDQSEYLKGIYPSPRDSKIKIYIPRKSWGLIDKDINIWTRKVLLGDYDNWADEFVDYENAIDHRNVSFNQDGLVFYCSDFQLQELIDVKPKENSAYVRSSTEPFDEDMRLDQERVKRWLLHFGLIKKEEEWNHIHVSGHGSGDEIKKIIEGSQSKILIPIHTQHEEYHKRWHPNVKEVALNNSIAL